MAPCVRTQYAMAFAYWMEHGRAFSFWMHSVRAFFFWTQPCQGIFLLDAAVSGQMASGRRVLWHRGYAGCQGTEHHSKYSHHIHKHAAGSRYSDLVQFYSLYLMYIYICYCYTSVRKHQGIGSYVVRARETSPNTARKGKSSPVGFRESRREMASGLDLTAVTDLRG